MTLIAVVFNSNHKQSERFLFAVISEDYYSLTLAKAKLNGICSLRMCEKEAE